MNFKRVAVLVVDDDEVAVMAIHRAMEKAGLKNPVTVASDGIEALEWLRAPDRLGQPCVVLLDLNMPRMNGLELLNHIRGDKNLRHVTVFMLSTSDAPQDIADAYARNVAGYILKEDAYRSIQGAVTLIKSYLETVTIPEYNCVKV